MEATAVPIVAAGDAIAPALSGDARGLADGLFQLLDRDDQELFERVGEMLRAEATVAAEQRRVAVATRLSALLLLNVEDARIIARAARAAQDREGETFSQKVRRAELHAVLHGFSVSDFRVFARLLPWLRDLDPAGLVLLGPSESEPSNSPTPVAA